MAVKYKYDEDGYDEDAYEQQEDDDDLPADWHYAGEPVRYRYQLKYNWETHVWECACDTFQFKGRCKHALRLRREEQVEVNERFL